VNALSGRLLPSLIAASLALGVTEVASLARIPDVSRALDRPVQRRVDGFVSSQACRACHPDQYASWHASYHRTMTQAATPQTAIPSFDNQVIDDVQGRPMRLWQDRESLRAEFDNPDADAPGGRGARVTRPVVLITGSHNQQIFWYATGHERLLGQLPGAYLVREQRWIPRRMAVLHPPSEPPVSETGHWNSTCIACHATHGRTRFDTPFGSRPVQTQSVQTDAAEFGIACEICHGSGEAHIRANANLLRRYRLHLTAAPDPLIVQPARLDPKRGSQVCGQCHSVWEFSDAESERLANVSGLPFRPGDELGDTRFVARPTVNADSPTMRALLSDDSRFIRDSFWPDGLVRVTGREYNGLLESPCYVKATSADRTLSCFSCHTMHKTPDDGRPLDEWADAQLSSSSSDSGSEPRGGNEACLQCHPSIRADLTSHTHHAANSSGSVCYNCHMPYTTYGLLKTARSHTVGSPSVHESTQTHRPNACNLCHLDRTLGWTGDALQKWYGVPAASLTGDQSEVAASLLWLLTGDGGLRAIVAQAMAWAPAQQASGTEWIAPYLAQLLDDPYDAVRIGAARSLRSLPGFASFQASARELPAERRQLQLRAMARWDQVRSHPGRASPELLMTRDGTVDVSRVLDLLKRQDNHPMLLRE
jgi:hypothetical protein